MVSPCGALVVIRKKELFFFFSWYMQLWAIKRLVSRWRNRFQASLLHLSQVFLGGAHLVQLYMLTRSSVPPPSSVFSLFPYLIKRKHHSFPLSYRKEASFTLFSKPETGIWSLMFHICSSSISRLLLISAPFMTSLFQIPEIQWFHHFIPWLYGKLHLF